ncbi:fungal hydrophobin domain-containing protein [Trichoderma breve]|uniref:Fungal hydrophobin domain-containing protein n=1 Tax=Trichoderma breve TaxID=2034170 RepID=A0A9W9B7Z2_9HYPO|nr:fungal hydrophobin domain-containing protein [Trichoderma breve]KAJ4854986.1 fungal hydrophobin domain-containing protein [Trichoderma breve]
MKSFFVATLLVAGVLAAPSSDVKRQASPCPAGLEATPQCCATDVLGIADLDCANPPNPFTDAASFTAVCAAIGQRARCCAIPVAGQDLLCTSPV